MKTAILVGLLALAALAAVPAANADCTDLAGQGHVCASVEADPNAGSFSVNVDVLVAPQIPPIA